MSETPNSGDSPMRIQEAESTQHSPEREQSCPKSPDSTIREGGSHVQPITSALGPILSTNENRNIGEDLGHPGLIGGNLSANENLSNQGELSSVSGSSSITDEMREMIANQPKLYGELGRNLPKDKDLFSKREQSGASKPIAQFGASTEKNESLPAQPCQVLKQKEISAISASASSGRADRAKAKLLLTDIFAVNPGANENLFRQRGKSGDSRLIAEIDASTEKRVSRPTDPREIAKQRRQKLYKARKMSQPSISTAKSPSTSPDRVDEVKSNLLLAVNPAANENSIGKRRQSGESRSTAQSRASAGKLLPRPSQPRQVIKQELSSASRLMAHPSPSAKSVSISPERGKIVKENLLHGNVIADNSAANANLVNKGEEISASGLRSQPSILAANENLLNQGQQSSEFERIAQPRTVSASTSSPAQSYQVFEQNQMLTNMFSHATIDEHMANTGASRSSYGQIVPDSPSRRKREGKAPDPEPSCSPTKKMKSPNKKK